MVQSTGKLKKINLKTQIAEPLPHSTLLSKKFKGIWSSGSGFMALIGENQLEMCLLGEQG